jgi:uncharacterized protein (UPF0335 family)
LYTTIIDFKEYLEQQKKKAKRHKRKNMLTAKDAGFDLRADRGIMIL